MDGEAVDGVAEEDDGGVEVVGVVLGRGDGDDVPDEVAGVDGEAAEGVDQGVEGLGAVFMVAHYPGFGALWRSIGISLCFTS